MSLMLVAVGWHCRYRIVAALVVLPLPPPHPGRSCAANAAAGADAHVFVITKRRSKVNVVDVGRCWLALPLPHRGRSCGAATASTASWPLLCCQCRCRCRCPCFRVLFFLSRLKALAIERKCNTNVPHRRHRWLWFFTVGLLYIMMHEVLPLPRPMRPRSARVRMGVA